MAETASVKRGGWGKVAAVEPVEDGENEVDVEQNGVEKRSARTIARDVGAAIEGRLAPAADRAARAMRTGAASVERALEDPTTSMASEIREQAELPELAGEDPLAELAVRLDREADLYRGMAMQQLARAPWMDRIGVIAAVVSLVGVAVLAAIAAFRALFAPDGAVFASMLLGVGAFLLLLGSWTTGRAAAKLRAGQAQSAREALARADLAEARLHRIAALLALRQADLEGYKAKLKELEADMRSSQ
jgi:hypothetical protein